MINNQMRSGYSNQANDPTQEAVEIFVRPVGFKLTVTSHHDKRVLPHGLRFNNPDPLELRQDDQRHVDLTSNSRDGEISAAWPVISRLEKLASGFPTQELENAQKRFFSVVDGMQQLKKIIGIREWADVPKTLKNTTAIANYLFMKPAINRLFDSVLDVQTVVESCWNAL